MTGNQPSDEALAETSAGAVQGGGQPDATAGPDATAPDGGGEDEFDAGDFVVDERADPPDEVQPTTS